MASYLEQQPYQFKPYVPTQPVEAMVKVGMIKQQQYDEGVQKIRTALEEQTMLPVSRDVDKEILQNAINGVTGQLKGLGAADFSNQQLVQSITGMTKRIVKDPNIIAAVQSTVSGQKEFEFMEEARKKGELTPQNELRFKNRWGTYLNSTDPGRVFTDKYTPFFDVDKHLKDVFNEVKPGGYNIEELYLTDENGKLLRDKQGNYIASPIMRTLTVEGRVPELVKKVLNQVLNDPRVSTQLQIDGEYSYRNVDIPGLVKGVQLQRDNQLASITEELATYQMKKNLAATQQEKDEIQTIIDNLTAKKINADKNYASLELLAKENPDAVRGVLYKDEAMQGYMTRFVSEKRTVKTEANPIWEARFKEQQERNKINMWAQEQDFLRQKHRDAMQIALLKIKATAEGKGKKGKSETDDDDEFGPTVEIDTEPSSRELRAEFTDKLTRAADDAKNSTDNFLFQSFFNTPENLSRIQQLEDTGRFTREQAISKVIDDVSKTAGKSPDEFRSDLLIQAESLANTSGLTSQPIIDAQRMYKQAQKSFNIAANQAKEVERAVVARVGQDIEKDLQKMDIKPQTVSLNGTTYNLSKNDVIDIARVLQAEQSIMGFAIDPATRTAGKAARQRLEQKGLTSVITSAKMAQTNERFFNPVEGLQAPLTTLGRTLWYLPRQVYNSVVGPFSNNQPLDMSQVGKVYDVLNDEGYEKTNKTYNEVLQEKQFVDPSVKMPLLSGKPEDIRNKRQNLARIAGSYAGIGNASGDFANFGKHIMDEAYVPDAKVKRLPDGSKAIEVVNYKEGKRESALTLRPDEAANVGIDADALFQPQEVNEVKNYISFSRNLATCAGEPTDVKTYIQGDAYYNSLNGDFPAIPTGSSLDVKANIAFRNGNYYPFVYVRDRATNNNKLISLPGSNDLNQVITTLKNSVKVSSLQAELMLK